MTSTPPPRAVRANTPPTPLHGPRYDNYEPYSPRRSKRSSAHSNPYSSFNSDRSPGANVLRASTPPPTVKQTRFARAPAQLSSPPSSPASPVRHSVHKTPRKPLFGARKTALGTLSDTEQPGASLAPRSIDPTTMLPTPSKTPSKKRQSAALHSTARVLNFQPNHPNDAMPSPRKIKKVSHHRSTNGFDLYDEEREASGSKISIFTDTNARVPEIDETEDNPFVGPKVRPQRRSKRQSKAQAEEEAEMEEAVRNEEGVVYVFRGKKILRRFIDADQDDAASSGGSELGNTAEQRLLKRKAGHAAARPLTRSSVKPRLLFPSQDDILDREARNNDIDEEALTDIDLPARSAATTSRQLTSTPPPTKRHAKATNGSNLTPTVEEDAPEAMSLSTDGPGPQKLSKKRSPFDSWQRTKGGVKRPNEVVEETSGKRTRSGAMASPL